MKNPLRIDKRGLSNILRPIAWLLAILVLVGGVYISVQQRKGTVVKRIAFDIQSLNNGKTLITHEDILLSIERSFGYRLEGVPLKELNAERVERVLEADPFIEKADVFVDAQNIVNINIQQREPLLRVIDKNGANYYLDEAGAKMPLSKHFAARVLVATGNIPPYTSDFLTTKNKGLLSDIFELSEYILADDFLKSQIEQLYVNSIGEITLVPKVGNQKIKLGKCVKYEEKLNRLKTFYQEGIPYIGWHKYKTIDLRYKDQVVCKKKTKANSSKIKV